MKTRDDSLNKEMAKKDEMIQMLQCQLRLNEEISQGNKMPGLDDDVTAVNVDQGNHDELNKQWEQENEERLKTIQDSLVS